MILLLILLLWPSVTRTHETQVIFQNKYNQCFVVPLDFFDNLLGGKHVDIIHESELEEILHMRLPKKDVSYQLSAIMNLCAQYHSSYSWQHPFLRSTNDFQTIARYLVQQRFPGAAPVKPVESVVPAHLLPLPTPAVSPVKPPRGKLGKGGAPRSRQPRRQPTASSIAPAQSQEDALFAAMVQAAEEQTELDRLSRSIQGHMDMPGAPRLPRRGWGSLATAQSETAEERRRAAELREQSEQAAEMPFEKSSGEDTDEQDDEYVFTSL